MSDGTTSALPPERVTWTSPALVTALSADSPLPAAGALPTGAFLSYLLRADRSDLAGVLSFFDSGSAGGTLAVTATVAGGGLSGNATGSVAVTAAPTGNATAGKAIYIATCSGCHGTTGHGSTSADGDAADRGTVSYAIDGQNYPYPRRA